MPGLDLGRHVEFRGAHDFGSASGRLAVRVPGRIVHAGMRAVRHQFVIGRMKLDFVAPVAAGVEGPQFRRVLVGEPAALGHRGRTPVRSEFGQFRRCRRPAIGGDGLRERSIDRKQIDIPNGGDWLNTSWVENDAGVIGFPDRRAPTSVAFRQTSRPCSRMSSRAQRRNPARSPRAHSSDSLAFA